MPTSFSRHIWPIPNACGYEEAEVRWDGQRLYVWIDDYDEGSVSSIKGYRADFTFKDEMAWWVEYDGEVLIPFMLQDLAEVLPTILKAQADIAMEATLTKY